MLPTCPACGQSVLDDDAAECPFCGASMSGKPGKAKPKPTPAAAAAKPTPTKKKPKPKPADDNPFESGPAKTASAIQAAPKPMKGRLLKVVCPMCDTPGFVPKKAAGRDVRCANKKCMVPVFKAPKPKRQVEAAPEPAQGGGSAAMIIGGLVALGIIGGVLFFLFGRKDTSVVVPPPTTKTEKGGGAGTMVEDIVKGTKTQPKTVDNTPVPLATVREAALQKLLKLAQGRSDDKPFCRRMVSESYVAVGQLDKAEEAIELIPGRGNSKFYYRAFPLLDLAWAYLEKGDAAKADAAIDKARLVAGAAPRSGRTEFTIRTELAAALTAAGRMDEGVQVLSDARPLRDDVDRQFAIAAARDVVAQAIAESPGDLSPVSEITDPVSPVWTGAVATLCARGKAELAAELASKAPDQTVRADSLAVAGTYAALKNQIAATGKVGEAVASAAPAVQVRVNAAIAYGAALGGHNAPATAALGKAEVAVAAIPKPQPVRIQRPRDLNSYEAPNPESSILAAKACSELARAQSELDQSKGLSSLQSAIVHTHSFCPSPMFMSDRLDEGMTAERLANILSLSERQAQTAVRNFNSKVKSLAKTSDLRLELQAQILRTLSKTKLAGDVQNIVAAAIKDEKKDFERLKDSGLPWQVAAAFMDAGKTDEAKQMLEALGEAGSPVVAAEIGSYGLLASPAQVARELSPRDNNDAARLEPLYRFARRFAAQDVVKATDFAKSVQNPNWKREILNLVGTQLSRNGHGRKLDAIVDSLGLESPDETAIYRGLVVGMGLDPEFKSVPQQ